MVHSRSGQTQSDTGHHEQPVRLGDGRQRSAHYVHDAAHSDTGFAAVSAHKKMKLELLLALEDHTKNGVHYLLVSYDAKQKGAQEFTHG